MPGIEWIATCNNTGFIRAMNEMATQVRQTKAVVEAMGDGTSDAINKIIDSGDAVVGKLKQIGALAGVAFSFSQAKSFIQKMAQTRAYFQDIESSMKVFLGSQEKAADFTKKLKDYAYYNMFEFADLAAASKQMIAYGHNVDTIIPRLDQLSNVARGTNAPLMEMVGAYNRAKNLGGLGGRDLQSWAAKGLVIKDILKDMGETVKDNKVSFEQLNRVLDKVTGEGGMFHNLMGEQMNNISAEQGQLEDVLDAMYNKIGEKYQDAIVKYYKMASATAEGFTENFDSFFDVGADTAEFLLDHYEDIGKALMSLVGAYGAYKAAFIATMAVENAYRSVKQKTIYDTEVKLLDEEIKKLKELLPAKEAAKNADLAEAVAKKQLTEEQAALIAARRAEFEQLQVDKELSSVNDSISKEKLKLLDLDLQEKVANEELTRSQAETIQKRREELVAIENQVAARRKLQMEKLSKQYDETERQQSNVEGYILDYSERNKKHRNEIADIDGDIAKLEALGGKEDEINKLVERRAELEALIESNNETILRHREQLNALEQQRQDILQKQHDTILQFGSDEEKLDLLKQDKIALQEEKAAYDSLVEKKEAELVIIKQQHEQSKERLRLLQEELTKQQQINMEKSKRGEAPDDLTSLSESVDIAALQEEADAKEENALATQMQEAAEKSEALQERINNVVEKENTIVTGGNTAAKGTNTAATNAATVSQRIHNMAVTAGSTVTKFFSTAITQATTALKGMGKAIMANPLGLILSAFMLVLPYLMDFIDAEKNAKNAQEGLNDAIEEHNKVLQDEENKDRDSIKTIKDKNASLYEQYEAYKELTKARGIFAQYTQEELKNMSQEQIDSLFSMDKAEKEKKMLQDRIQMYKEYQQWVGTGWRAGRAILVADEEDKLKELQEKYNMGTEATDAFKSQSSMVSNAQMAEAWVQEAENLLRERLEGEARAGVANGLKSGFADPEVQGKAAALISDFSQEIKNISQDDLATKGVDLASKYKEQLTPTLEEARQKVKDLNSELANATGDKKVKLQAEVDTAQQTYDFLNSVMSFFEAGSANKTLTLEVVRESENSSLDKNTLQDLAKESEGIEVMTDKWLSNIEKVQDKLNGMGAVSEDEARRVAEEFGLTSENMKEDFDSVEERLKEDISRLQDKYNRTSSEIERNKLNIEIARKQQLLDSVQSIGDKVWDVVKNPYTLTIKIKSVWEDTKNFLKGALGKAMPSFWGDGGAQAQAQNRAGNQVGNVLKQIKEDAKVTTTTETKNNEQPSAEQSDKEKREAQRRAKEAADRRKKVADIERKNLEREEKQRQETENAIEEARIASIKDNGERERAEQEYQHKKRLQAIEDQRDQMKKALYDYNKSLWEAKNTDKTTHYEDTEEGKAGWQAVKSVADRTKEMEEAVKTASDNLAKYNISLPPVDTSSYEAAKEKVQSLVEEMKQQPQSESGSQVLNEYITLLNKFEQADSSYRNARYKLSEQQEAQLKADTEKEDAENQRRLLERMRAEAQAMRDYLKEYGSIEQQKLAITEEYEQKIKDAKTEGEKMKLQKELEQVMVNFSFESLANSIDWKALLGGVENLSKDMMKPMLQRLEAAAKTEAFRNADADKQQKIVDLITEIRQYVGSDDDTTFSDLAEAIANFNTATAEYNKSVEDEIAAKKAYDVAVQNLENGTGTQEEVDRTKKLWDEAAKAQTDARDAMESFGKEVNNCNDLLVKSAGVMTQVLNNLSTWSGVGGFDQLKQSSSSLDQLNNTIKKQLAESQANKMKQGLTAEQQAFKDNLDSLLGSGQITKDVYDDSMIQLLGDNSDKLLNGISSALGGLSEGMGGILESVLGSGIGQMVGVIAQIPSIILSLADAIKNMVTGILDSFTELLRFEWLSDLVVSITDAIANLIDAIFDLPESIGKLLKAVVWDGIGGMLDSIIGRVTSIFGIHGNPSDWFTNSNAEEVAETTERLTKVNQTLSDRISDLQDDIGNAAGLKAIEATQAALEAQEELQRNNMEILRAQMGYHDAHHSNQYYTDDKEIERLYKEAKERLNRVGYEFGNISNLEDIYKLAEKDPAYLKAIKDYAPDLWEYLTTVGKYDKSDYWEKVVEEAGVVDELTEKIRDNLTQTSFDSLRSSFLDTLTDMESDSEDFANSFMDMMFKAMVNSQILDDEFNEWLKNWQKEYAEAVKTNNVEALENLRKQALEMRDEKIGERDLLAQTMGLDAALNEDKSATITSTDKITYDQADLLIGIVTAIQIAVEHGNNDRAMIMQNLYTIEEATRSNGSVVAGIRNLLITTNEYLYDIRESNDAILSEFGVKMDRIVKRLEEF